MIYDLKAAGETQPFFYDLATKATKYRKVKRIR